jgi:protein-disulfide isomerase
LDVTAGIAIIAIATVLLWRTFGPRLPPVVIEKPRQQGHQIPKEPVDLVNAHFKGSPSAPVWIVEYADFECPACAAFAKDTFPTFIKTFVDTGRVRLGFRHFPLARHAMAEPAAIAAECAGNQGKFWDYYQFVFNRTGKLDTALLGRAADSLGLDRSRWSACQAGERQVVAEQLAQARSLRLRGTPAFLVGRPIGQERMTVTSVLLGVRELTDFNAAVQLAQESSSQQR